MSFALKTEPVKIDEKCEVAVAADDYDFMVIIRSAKPVAVKTKAAAPG